MASTRRARRTQREDRCPRGLEVQTLIFPLASWNERDARGWAKSQGFRVSKIDTTSGSHRFRQRDPKDFTRGSFRTITLSADKDVRAVVGCPLPGRESDKRARDPQAFHVGQRVVLARVRHAAFQGREGVIKRIYKTKGEALVVLAAGRPGYQDDVYSAKLANLDPASTSARDRRDEIAEMRELLQARGYENPQAIAERLNAEGMGPFELEDRLRHREGTVGSLEYTHNIKRSRPLRRDVARYDLSPAGQRWLRAYQREGATPSLRAEFEQLSRFDKAAVRFIIAENGNNGNGRDRARSARPNKSRDYDLIRQGFTDRVVGTYDSRAEADRERRKRQKQADEDFKEGRITYDVPTFVVRERLESGLRRDPRQGRR